MYKRQEFLAILAKDASKYVREAVAKHYNTPLETFAVLAEDADPRVRRALVFNGSVPLEVLKRLKQDQHVGIRIAAADVAARRNN